jgi:hypothetical protein
VNNLNRSPDFPQFRCLPMTGGTSQQPFRYVSNLQGVSNLVTRDDIERAVGDYLRKSNQSGG